METRFQAIEGGGRLSCWNLLAKVSGKGSVSPNPSVLCLQGFTFSRVATQKHHTALKNVVFLFQL